MKKISRWFKDIFNLEEFNDLDTTSIMEAMNDASVRQRWLIDIFEELKRINLEVDKRLLLGVEIGYIDLCARRKAYQDVLEGVLSAKRQVAQEIPHNQAVRPSGVDLDRLAETLRMA